MARQIQTITTYTCDLCGKEVGEDGNTVQFGYQGKDYEIDLCAKDSEKVVGNLAFYADHAQRMGGARRASRSRGRSGGGPDPKAVRSWAQANGWQVPARGRVPRDVIDAYEAAQA